MEFFTEKPIELKKNQQRLSVSYIFNGWESNIAPCEFQGEEKRLRENAVIDQCGYSIHAEEYLEKRGILITPKGSQFPNLPFEYEYLVESQNGSSTFFQRTRTNRHPFSGVQREERENAILKQHPQTACAKLIVELRENAKLEMILTRVYCR